MNKFMGHQIKRKMEGSRVKEGGWVISGRLLLSGHRRCTQKHCEDSIKYHMQWPYCHGYGTVENINQVCTCNGKKDGGRRDSARQQWERQSGRRGEEDNGIASRCDCVCMLDLMWVLRNTNVWMQTSTSVPTKLWTSVCGHRTCHFWQWISNSQKPSFFNEKIMKPKPNWLTFLESQMWKEYNLKLISYRGELTFQLEKICFSCFSFRLTIMCPNACRCFLS